MERFAEDRPIVLTGDRGLVLGMEGEDSLDVWSYASGRDEPDIVSPLRIVRDLHCPDPGAAGAPLPPIELALAPGSMRRETWRSGRDFLEPMTQVVLVPRSFPGAVLQWSRSTDAPGDGGARISDGRRALDFPVAWEAPGSFRPGSVVRYLQRGPLLRILSEEGDCLLYYLAGDPFASWTVTEPGVGRAPLPDPERPQGPHGSPSPRVERASPSAPTGLRIEVRLQLNPGEFVRLVALGGSEADVDSAWGLLAHLPAHELRRKREGIDARQESLAVDLSASAELLPETAARIEAGVEWAKARLDGALIESGGGRRIFLAGRGTAGGDALFLPLVGAEAAVSGLGALASGRFDLAGGALAALAGESEGGRSHLDFVLLAAEYGLWSGDVDTLQAMRGALDRAADAVSALATDLSRAGLRALADAVEPLGDSRWPAGLRALADSDAPAGASRSGATSPDSDPSGRSRSPEAPSDPGIAVIRLPMLGRGNAPRVKSEEAHPLEWPGRSAFASGDPTGGCDAWLTHLAPAFDPAARSQSEGAAGNAHRAPAGGAWFPPNDDHPHHPGESGPRFASHTASAARVVLPLVLGVLGARPDAGYGRLLLAPLPPPSWTDFTVSNLRIGDSRIFIRYRRRGRQHTFTLRQTEGRTPINLVFEPAVAPKGASIEVRLAAERVEVDTFIRGERLAIRLQLPLDFERSVTIDEGDIPTA